MEKADAELEEAQWSRRSSRSRYSSPRHEWEDSNALHKAGYTAEHDFDRCAAAALIDASLLLFVAPIGVSLLFFVAFIDVSLLLFAALIDASLLLFVALIDVSLLLIVVPIDVSLLLFAALIDVSLLLFAAPTAASLLLFVALIDALVDAEALSKQDDSALSCHPWGHVGHMALLPEPSKCIMLGLVWSKSVCSEHTVTVL